MPSFFTDPSHTIFYRSFDVQVKTIKSFSDYFGCQTQKYQPLLCGGSWLTNFVSEISRQKNFTDDKLTMKTTKIISLDYAHTGTYICMHAYSMCAVCATCFTTENVM